MAQQKQERVRNVKAFINGMKDKEHVKKLLNRQTFRNKSGVTVWQNPAFAQALVNAASK